MSERRFTATKFREYEELISEFFKEHSTDGFRLKVDKTAGVEIASMLRYAAAMVERCEEMRSETLNGAINYILKGATDERK